MNPRGQDSDDVLGATEDDSQADARIHGPRKLQARLHKLVDEEGEGPMAVDQGPSHIGRYTDEEAEAAAYHRCG